MNRIFPKLAAASLVFIQLAFTASVFAAKKSKLEKQQDSLDQYVKQLAVAAPMPLATTSGSLFISSGLLADPYSDFKAHSVGDSVAVHRSSPLPFRRAAASPVSAPSTIRVLSPG